MNGFPNTDLFTPPQFFFVAFVTLRGHDTKKNQQNYKRIRQHFVTLIYKAQKKSARENTFKVTIRREKRESNKVPASPLGVLSLLLQDKTL